MALAKTKARAELFPGGLIISTIPETMSNIQVIAAQAADGLLRIENVRMSILIFQLTEDTIGLSARSTGDLNVQVIMEALGGGGHQNVAGAQVKGASLADIKAKVIEISEKYIEDHFSEIIGHASAIESRLSDADCTMDSLKTDNRKVINGFQQAAEQVVIIDSNYEQTIKALLI